jgi:hypothetical protein
METVDIGGTAEGRGSIGCEARSGASAPTWPPVRRQLGQKDTVWLSVYVVCWLPG